MAGKSFTKAELTRRVSFVAVLLATSLAGSAASVRAGLPQRLRNTLAHLPHRQTRVGACVVDLATGETVLSLHADAPMLPASTMKLFAMSVAIEELGSNFAFETVLATDGINLYLLGDGDPAFGDAKLARRRDESIYAEFVRWAALLRDSGVGNIPGDLIIDESIFDAELLHPSWETNDLGKWFAAPVGALNFNDNCVDITLTPQVPGTPPKVTVVPETSVIRVINTARSGGKGKPVLHHPFNTFDYRVSGRCRKRWPFGPASFPDPGLLFAESMRTVFADLGVTFSGSVKRQRVRLGDGSLPQTVSVLATHQTPLGDVLNRAGKNSQNLFAEALLKRAGYAWARRTHHVAPVGSWTNGAYAVEALMHRVGTSLGGFHLADGSGLSRKNRCSARQQVATLVWINKQRWSPLLRDNLSVAGVDGSLGKRLKRDPNRVFAKTGTMRGVCVLTGYVVDADRPRFAFSVMFNGYPGPSRPYRAIQDEFGSVLIRATDDRSAP